MMDSFLPLFIYKYRRPSTKCRLLLQGQYGKVCSEVRTTVDIKRRKEPLSAYKNRHPEMGVVKILEYDDSAEDHTEELETLYELWSARKSQSK